MTPSSLQAIMMGVQQKIIVPKSLQQQILKECHNVPFIGHMSMSKTLELVDWHSIGEDYDVTKFSM